jgi:transposase
MDYGAIDLHKRYTWIRLVTADGVVTLERRVPTTREALTAAFRGRRPARVLIASSTESEWVAQTIEACGHEVIVASPGYALMYGHRDPRIKTDRRDVVALAEACRHGIYRAAHRVSAAQRQRRRELRVRELLVRQRTALINLLRAELRQEGIRLRSCAAESVGRQYRALALPPALVESLAPVLAGLEDLTDAIAASTAALTAAAQADPIVRRLQTAPGVGPITALTFRAVVECAQRGGLSRLGPEGRQLRRAPAQGGHHESRPAGPADAARSGQLDGVAAKSRARRAARVGRSARGPAWHTRRRGGPRAAAGPHPVCDVARRGALPRAAGVGAAPASEWRSRQMVG